MIIRDSNNYGFSGQQWLPVKVEESGAQLVTDDYAETLYYYDVDGNIEYLCQNRVHGKSLSSEDWVVTKLTHGANGITNRERLVGSVDDRAVLSWR
jgi:hypothetical protein